MKLSFFTSFITFVLCSLCTAQEMSQPPLAPMRPTIPKLYLSSAGSAPFAEMMLQSFQDVNICTQDYPSGYTIRCAVQNTEQVDFYVANKHFKLEMYPPFYLNGNIGDTVYRFNGLQNVTRLRIGCRVATRRAVWVNLVKTC